jgi:hypothetical protein
VPLVTKNILLDAADGVIVIVKVFEAVTKLVDDVLLSVVSVAVKTCKTFPPPASAKVLSPLKESCSSL